MNILRRRQSTQQGGDLCCQNTLVVGGIKIPCRSQRLKFLSSEGPVDIYQCKDCGCKLRYHTVPLDSHGSQQEQLERRFEGLHSKQLGGPNLGNFKVTKKILG